MAEQLLSTDPRAGQLLSADPGAGAITPDFTATNEPPSTALKAAAYGKDALQLALDALPGAGAVVGGVLATPETAGAGTLVGSALGAGAGRGLRDLIASGLGLQKPDTAAGEGGKMALDSAETYAAGRILPALWSAIKAPGATVADVYAGVRSVNEALPKLLRWNLPKLPPGVGKAPAAILERPAWQSWQDHLPDAQPSPQVARTTGTSMIPAPVPGPRPSPPPAAPPVAAAPVPVETPPPAAVAAPAAAGRMPNQIAINALGLAARRANLALTLEEVKALVPLVEQGATPEQVIGAVVSTRLAASPAAAFAARFGTPTPAEAAADMAARRAVRKSR